MAAVNSFAAGVSRRRKVAVLRVTSDVSRQFFYAGGWLEKETIVVMVAVNSLTTEFGQRRTR